MEMDQSYTERAPSITRHGLKSNRGTTWNTWRRDLEADVGYTGCSWEQIEKTVQDRGQWRAFVSDLCFRRNKRF